MTAVRSPLAGLGMEIFQREGQDARGARRAGESRRREMWPIIKELGIKAE